MSLMKCSVAIYGAQMVAVRVYFALKKLYPDVRTEVFLVSSQAGNPSSIDGIPVMEFKEFHRRDMRILIAAPDVHHSEVTAALEERDFTNYQCIDSKAEAELLKAFYGEEGRFCPLASYSLGPAETAGNAENTENIENIEHTEHTKGVPLNIAVYMSKFYKDRPLKSAYELPAWVHPIQAGAALTESRIADILDNEGEHISMKNPNYSELTASYWAGKHGTADYLGLYHYRRILDVTGEDLRRIGANDIDVVLPYPSMHCPDIREHRKRYLKDADWEAMLLALKELEPAYGEALPKLFQGQYFYNFNMLIAKREIYRQYCDWMFPILARTEELSVPKGSERKDRYIGYLGESLTTLFFLYHEKDFKIAHTGCLMLI